jgi:hypothetical protein
VIHLLPPVAKLTLKIIHNFVFIFCRPNLLFIRHIITKNEIYKLIRSTFGIFSIISCLIYSALWYMHTQVFSHNFTMLN